jgi:hypothetical protein
VTPLLIDLKSSRLIVVNEKEATMPFNIGDVVQLKSGSPRMTVTNVGHAGGKEAVLVLLV